MSEGADAWLGLRRLAVIAAALAALWILVAVALSLAAARRFRLAEQVLSAARANATLLEISPARPLVVRADGRIEIDPQLLRELGLKVAAQDAWRTPLNDSGCLPDDLTALTAEIDFAKGFSFPNSREDTGRRVCPGVRGSRRSRAGTRTTRDFAPLVFRHERRRRRAGKARASPAPDGGRTQFADAPDRGCALPDVVSRTRPQARSREQRVRECRRRQGCAGRHRTIRRADRRAGRGQRRRDGARGAGRRPHRLADAAGDHSRRTADAEDRQRSAFDRGGRRALRSTSRTWKTLEPNLPATGNPSASLRTG